MTQALKDKVILITGASQGLGAAIAFAYAEEGATVILLGRNIKKLEKVYDSIVEAGLPTPFALSFDLLTATEHDFRELALTCLQAAARLDGIVHCAAYLYALSPIEFQTIEEWTHQYHINTIAPMALTRAFLPTLIQSCEDASVIFVGESHSETPQAFWGGFGASKAALNYLCLSLADEYTRYPHFRANVLIPGIINSPQRQKTHPGESPETRLPIEAILSDFVYWMGKDSLGKTGQLVYLQQTHK